MSFTPGPWETSINQDKTVSIFGCENLIATVADTSHTSCNTAANAHLIASAPELLTALEGLVSAMQYSHAITGLTLDAFIDAQAVIARVKGE